MRLQRRERERERGRERERAKERERERERERGEREEREREERDPRLGRDVGRLGDRSVRPLTQLLLVHLVVVLPGGLGFRV